MYAQVLVHLPIDRPFTYAVPEGMKVSRGMRVLVPFREKPLSGFVLETGQDPPPFPAKEIIRAGEVLVDETMFALSRWMADRYLCSWGEALEAMIPTGVKKKTAARVVRRVRIAEGADIAAVSGPKQRRTLEALKEGGALLLPELVRILGTRPDLKPLLSRGLIAVDRVEAEIDVLADVVRESPKEIRLTPHQERALKVLREHPTAVVLLHGVTGSGKTEVYLRAIEGTVATGRQAIVLVPEIALTPQTVARFQARFPRIAVLHSVLSEGDRAAQWRATRTGEAQVIVGARSAIFAPTLRLGLIVVDEEHEGAYKQESAPRYHAREVAIERARREGAGVLLGSATPSLESLDAAREGQYRTVILPERIEGRPMPEIEVVDMTAEKMETKRFPILSRRLLHRMTESLSRGEQVLLFLNRRGFVTQIRCPRCGWVLRCRRCDVALTYHRAEEREQCHYCFETRPRPDACPACGGRALLEFGVGTERIEDEVRVRFPDRTVGRMDRDAMKTKKDYRESLSGLWSGKTDILIGTQMIAKGFDVPNVTLVGVVNADTAFHVPDFRAAERTFQLVTQVAGRAGRGPRGGRVVVQTFNPQHYAITSAAAYDFDGFTARELEMRRELAYPPYARLVRIILQGTNEKRVRQAADRFANKLRPALGDSGDILGPAPAPLFRIKGRYRMHLLVKTQSLEAVRPEVMRLLHSISRPLQAIVDVDPVNMM